MEGKTKRASGRGLYAEGDKNPHEHDGTVHETTNPTGTKKTLHRVLWLPDEFL